MSPTIADRATLERLLPGIDQVALMEQAFIDWSAGRVQMSAVGSLLFDAPPGDVHIKAGHIAGSPVFVVKIAAGFYDNPKLGLASSTGLVLAFDAATGATRAILLDDGLLTDERTAAAGAVAAKHLARPDVAAIAVLGAGTQARLQLKHLMAVTPCRELLIWARRADAAEQFARDAAQMGFHASIAATPREAARAADLIVTTTPSTTPLLDAGDVRPGAHITAMGSDDPHKQELSGALLAGADLIAADSIAQCRQRGELRRAPDAGPRIVELGDVIAGRAPGRERADQITVADLTGLAAQDAALAGAVLGLLEERA